MSFIVPTAYAATGTTAAQGSASGSILLFAVLLIFLFFLWYPQQKRVKQLKKMLSDLKVNDEVMTGGGLAGKIIKMDDNFVKLAIAKEVEIMLQRSAISSILPKGTLKSL